LELIFLYEGDKCVNSNQLQRNVIKNKKEIHVMPKKKKNIINYFSQNFAIILNYLLYMRVILLKNIVTGNILQLYS